MSIHLPGACSSAPEISDVSISPEGVRAARQRSSATADQTGRDVAWLAQTRAVPRCSWPAQGDWV